MSQDAEKQKQPLVLPNECPKCGLILLHGAIFDAVGKSEEFGPILGLHRNIDPALARAGYVGISSLYSPEKLRDFYQCPRCHTDPFATQESKGP